MSKIESIQDIYNSEIDLIIKQSSILLQKKADGFNGELKTSGSIIENYVKGIIRNQIPSGYRVCSGYIATTDSISNLDNLSQHDLIIVDERTPSIYKFGVSDIEVVSAEAVCGIIEIKRTLTKKSLADAVAHLERTKNILDKYRDGHKSKTARTNAAGPNMSIATDAPLYAVLALSINRSDLNDISDVYNQKMLDFLDMIWTLSDGFLCRFCIRNDNQTFLPLTVSRKMDPGNEPMVQLHNGNEETYGQTFRIGLSIFRTWISKTSGSALDSNLNLKYFGILK